MSSENVDPRDTTKLNKFQNFFYEYGRYHRNLGNVIIHIICVPIITFTYFKIFEHYQVNSWNLGFNPFYIFYGIWVPIWIYTDFFSGLLTSVEYAALDFLTQGKDFGLFGLSSITTLFIINIIAWIVQFIGHGFFEKRKPALLDNILLVSNAPVFVNIELLIFLFGYRKPEIEEAKKFVDADIKIYRSSKKRE